MSDYDDDDLNDTLDPDEQQAANTDGKNWRRELEKREKNAKSEAEQAAREAREAKRELAFVKAGIDLDTPHGKLFAKAYDGDPTADAVRAAAQEFGIVEAPTPEVPAAELAAHDRFTEASAGGTASDADAAMAALNAASTQEEVIAALRAANPELVDYQGQVTKWAVGGQNTPVTTPMQ